MTTLIQRLQWHLDGHKYTKGAFVGDAPADKSRRAKTNFRLCKTGYGFAIRFHHTDLVKITDTTIVVDCCGWSDSPTTRDAVAEALSLCGLAQLYMSARAPNTYLGRYVYHDGITLSHQGDLLSPPIPELHKRIDADMSREFHRALREHKTHALFQTLAACRDPHARRTYPWRNASHLRALLTNPEQFDKLPEIVAQCGGNWHALMKAAKQDLYRLVPKV